jgi:hypothetical protein
MRSSVLRCYCVACGLQAYAAIAEQCWQEEPAARPTFAQLVEQLQQLQQQEDALQVGTCDDMKHPSE